MIVEGVTNLLKCKNKTMEHILFFGRIIELFPIHMVVKIFKGVCNEANNKGKC